MCPQYIQLLIHSPSESVSRAKCPLYPQRPRPRTSDLEPSPQKAPMKVSELMLTTADTVHVGGVGRMEGGVNEGGGEVLSHLISLDMLYQASLRRFLSPLRIHSPVKDATHAYTGACTSSKQKQAKDKHHSHLAP